jgi:hypothetical protein
MTSSVLIAAALMMAAPAVPQNTERGMDTWGANSDNPRIGMRFGATSIDPDCGRTGVGGIGAKGNGAGKSFCGNPPLNGKPPMNGNPPELSVNALQFEWSQAPGGTLEASTPATVTLTGGCPIGVNGGNPDYYVYISGGTGTAEAVTVTGGTCVSGASTGTLTFTPANHHAGAWTVGTSQFGVPEAVNSVATQASITIPAGTYQSYAPSYISKHVCIRGSGPDSTVINNNNVKLGVFRYSLTSLAPTGGACLRDLTIGAGGETSTSIRGSAGTAVYVQGDGGSGLGASFENLVIKNHNVSMDLEGVLETYLNNFTFLYQNTIGLKLNGSAHVNSGLITNGLASGLPATSTGCGILLTDGGGIYLNSIDVPGMPNGVCLKPSASGLSGVWATNVLADTSNQHGWLIDATNAPVNAIECTACEGSFNGGYSPAVLDGNITSSATSITVKPNPSQPYPAGRNTLTIGLEQIICSAYSSPAFSGCTRAANGTTAVAHCGQSGSVAPCNGTGPAVVWVFNFAGDGVHVTGPSSNISGITFNGGTFATNGASAMNFTAGSQIQVNGPLAGINSALQTGGYPEFNFGEKVRDFAVRNGTIGYYGFGPATVPSYAIRIAGGSEDNFQIVGNKFVSGGTTMGMISNRAPGIHTVISNNEGVDDARPTVASAVALPLPVNPSFVISGTATVTSVTGQSVRSGTFTTTGTVRFSAGSTIGTSCTTTPGSLYTYSSDGTLFSIAGRGC